jgi:hypothetical protein
MNEQRPLNEQIERAFFFMQHRYGIASEEVIGKLSWIDEKTKGAYREAILLIQEDLRLTQKRLAALGKQWQAKETNPR